MFLVQLVYTSKTSSHFGPEDIENILEKARINNRKNNVTGLLCFNNNFFLQCLEGSRSAVNNTYHHILNDKRHSDIIMLNYSEIAEREFEQWSMGYMPQTSLTDAINLKYSGTPNFDPYEMSGESTHKLMLALKQNIKIT
ncbi:MAG: hypothetical protein ACI9YH_001870 [Colwellia sp.]|jgi:hypothetical protein